MSVALPAVLVGGPRDGELRMMPADAAGGPRPMWLVTLVQPVRSLASPDDLGSDPMTVGRYELGRDGSLRLPSVDDAGRYRYVWAGWEAR